MDYLSLLPKDVKNIIDLNYIMNMDHNEFIRYCQENNCNEELWLEKGRKDFKRFGQQKGKSNQAKYLRASSIREISNIELPFNPKQKLEKELNESNYRHRAKLLDYDGKYDEYKSFNYIIDNKEIIKIDKDINKLSKYVPNSDDKWLVYIYNLDLDLQYILTPFKSSYRVLDWQSEFDQYLFENYITKQFEDYEEGMTIYDR